MARPAKTGLDYFPLDVGFLRDKKVRLLRAEFGASSVLFVLYVLGKAYEGDGYFLKWDKDEALIAADELRERPQYISEVLQGCLSRSLFDERVFQVFGVLTSAGIQRRYLRSCEKRDDIEICSEYWLLDVNNKKDVPSGIRAKLTFFGISGGNNRVNSPENRVNSPENPESKVKESKVKESKVKESKVKESKGHPADPGAAELSKVMAHYQDTIDPTPTTACTQEIITFIGRFGADIVLHAIDRARDNLKAQANWAYIRGILRGYTKDNVKTLDDVLSLEQQFDAGRERRAAQRGRGTGYQPPTGKENIEEESKALEDMRKMYERMVKKGGAP